MSSSTFAANYKVGTRIYAGFLLILVLVAVVAFTGIYASSDAEEGFKEYALIVENGARVNDIATDVADMRRHVVNYANTGDDDAAKRGKEIAAQIKPKLNDVIAHTRNAERKANLERMAPLLDEYLASLTRLFEIRESRDQAVEERMNPMGTKARESLTTLAASALADSDMEAVALAGQAQEKLLLARISALRFLAKADPQSQDETRKRNEDASVFIHALPDRLRDPQRQRLARDAGQFMESYLKTFNEVATATLDVQKLAVATMPRIGTDFTDLTRRAVAAQTAARTALLAATNKDMEAATTLELAITGVAIVVGLLAAWTVARSIVRPVLGMTGTMTKLAAGDLAVDVPCTTNKDEIGEMAKAVEVFKLAAIANREMEERQRAEQAAREARTQRVDQLIKTFDG